MVRDDETPTEDDMTDFPHVADRPRGFLTERDRRYLTGEMEVEARSNRERDIRRVIRRRAWNALLDLCLLDRHMEPRDRRTVFAGDEDEAVDREIVRETGLSAMVSLVYKATVRDRATWLEQSAPVGAGGTARFEDILEHAVHSIAGRPPKGSLRVADPSVTVSIDGPVDISLDELVQKAQVLRDAEEGGVPADESWRSIDVAELLVLYWVASSDGDGVAGYSAEEIGGYLFERLAAGEDVHGYDDRDDDPDGELGEELGEE